MPFLMFQETSLQPPGLEMVLGLTDWDLRDGKKGKKEGEKSNSPRNRHILFSWKLSFAEAHFHSHTRMDRCLSQLNGTRPTNTLLKSTECLSELGGRNTTKGVHTLFACINTLFQGGLVLHIFTHKDKQ